MARKRLLVEKRNILNDIISREFTLQELRLFSIYLGHINPRDISSRQVRLTLNQFYKVMDLQPVRTEYLKDVTHNLLTKVICIQTSTGGFDQFQLFKRCKVDKDIYGKWFFEIDAHDDALQLMFDYKRDYFTYELWNVLNCESVNQFRMYEILKEYEWRGERIISVKELKALLGIEEKEYTQWNNFRLRVLNACQKALKDKTDICFTYEPCARSGRGGRIESLKFNIIKNYNYTNKMNLESFFSADVFQNTRQESVKQKSEAGPDVSCLDFITEPISTADKLSILQAAERDIELIKEVYYEIAKQQNNIDNFVGFMVSIIKKLRNGEIGKPVKVITAKINRFVNFTQREIDFKELEKLELEQLKESMKGDEILENCN